MGQKVHPKSFRLGVIKSWSSRWFASKKGYAHLLHRDITLRKAIAQRLPDSGINNIEIERSAGNVKIHIFTSKPGIIIGRQGAAIEELRQDLTMKFGEKVEVNIVEIKRPDSEAQLIADNIAGQIERRLPYRRAAKSAVQKAIEVREVEGIKVRVAGRLNGADIARNETFKEGNIPLHTIRADVDYATAKARTTYGVIGIKVWTYKGEVFAGEEKKSGEDQAYLAQSRKKKAEKSRLEEEAEQAA